ncbi:bifunctional 2-C-methyl-D-erythritol 4-phosphate cytidylyltransferase/2-C-methyl-D-erythritol 2,4-cyclodiphosphate synthase [Pseudochelatococcus lubricantis]|uniref:bifunctional 2-C-methyl-D-erythritol 4-phosphate cytidylyltransferase/2-C-methyl-D-erythritol 2,4-cyclodiphosphate synthase n=1 Tax=Pseudochelatococcus lubricantis TaxID=1538102 RepID=UPI0035E5935D
MSDIAAIVVAAGRGERAGAGVPKQYRTLGDAPVLAHTLGAFAAHPAIGRVLAVIGEADAIQYKMCLSCLPDTRRLLAPVSGGNTRQASVHAGLAALADTPPAIVLVHDGARPFVSPALITEAIAAARAHGAAIPGLPVTDTVKIVDEAGRVTGTPERAGLRAVQTPQAFAFAPLHAAHERARAEGRNSFTDDAAIMEWAGHPVHVFPGEATNMKLTRPEDFDTAERHLRRDATLVSRTGTGFDVHAFADGDHVWLGGVKIPHARGVIAHSDGDVVLHALTDAVLGALADGDIGSHFPPSDPQWKGASSDRFLAHAVALLHARGGVLDHLDATVICEAPKVGPHREAIRARIAVIAGLPLASVSIKATTSERLGFTGRGEGIAAQAAATVRLPANRHPTDAPGV